MIWNIKAIALAPAAFGMLAAACQTASISGPSNVPTLKIGDLVRIMERYRGQTVRVCGNLAPREPPNEWRILDSSDRDPVHGFPVIYIVSYSTTPPALDRAGCIVGRVARKDGSIELPTQRIITDARVNRDWYLHPIPPNNR